MRTLLVGVIAGVMLAALLALSQGGSEVSADGGPHVQGASATTDSCAGCHRAHTGVADNLLAQTTQLGLCYSCHGTGGPGSDAAVQEGKLYGSPSGSPYGGKTTFTALKAGGFDSALINTADGTANTIGALGAAAATTSWHNNDGTTAGTLWGNGALNSGAGPAYNTLSCGSCHDPHGNGNYRILRTIPSGSGGSGQAVTDAVVAYDTTNYYDVTHVSGSEMSNWCSQCHTRYLSSTFGDSGDGIFKYRHKTAGTGGSSPTCIKCHAAHGSNATMGANSGAVTLPDGTAGGGASDSRLLKMDSRGICQKCHNK